MEIAFIIGRIIFGGYFLKNAYNHIFKSAHLVGYAQSKGVKSPKIAIIGSGILLAFGGLSMILGVWTIWGAVALIAFLIPVSLKMHDFWKIQDPMARMGERISFEKNMALAAAALITMAISTPWIYSAF
ncbi:MAG: DoxX family protein [Patescibacteria group bacterium]